MPDPTAPLSRARQLYPPSDPSRPDDFIDYDYDYDPIIRSLGNVLVKVKDGGYQGDTRLLLEKDGRYGFSVIGWGSCTGCDALRQCSTYDEADKLISQIENEVTWFDTLEDAKAYISNMKDRRFQFYSHQLEWIDFVAQVRVFQPSPMVSLDA